MRRLRMLQIGLIIPGIIILAGLTTIGLGSLTFRTNFNVIANNVFSNSITKQDIVAETDLAKLPDTVQRYLHYTGVAGREKINTVRLKQKGTLRQTLDDSWKNITAVEYFSVNPPAFVWMGQMAAGPFSIISARDSYFNEHGYMFIKMLGTKTIGDVKGEEMDYSSLVRYLNEMMWFPTAFVNDNIRWDAIDDDSARVTIIDGHKSASAILYFDKKGALTNFAGERYHEVNGVYVKDIWETPMTGYGEFNGLRLPIRGEAVWKMSRGDFSYINLEITELEYNVTETYR
jgi:hypothetical protein